MSAKIVGRVTTLPNTWICPVYGPVDRDTWIDLMLTAHDDCESYYCYRGWVTFVAGTYRSHGVPLPDGAELPFKEFSLVLVNDMSHMLEASEMAA